MAPITAGLLALVSVALLSMPAPTQAYLPTVCPAGNTAFDSRCYFYSGNGVRKKWPDALEVCKSKGSSLVSIHTLEENEFVHDWCEHANNRQVCWIGLYQVQGQTGSNYQWTDGSPVSYTKWAPGEPNNVQANGEDCGQIWNRLARGDWNDEPCNWFYSYVCTQEAKCPAGAYERLSYQATPNRKADCTDCPAGTFRDIAGGKLLEACEPCPAGRMGVTKETRSTCTSACPAGFFCNLGTPSCEWNKDCPANQGPEPCPAGFYSSQTGVTSSKQCVACAAGFFCQGVGEISSTGKLASDSTTKQCKASFCGITGQSEETCSESCRAGYWCPKGSACPGTACSARSSYCAAGSSSPTSVTSGYYSVRVDDVSVGQAQCPKGYYCVAGVQTKCPAGTYNDMTRSTGASACKPCDAGFYCDPETQNISPQQQSCAPLTAPTADKASYFCPQGTETRQRVQGTTHYTLPVDGPIANRESEAVCLESDNCSNGLATPILSWNALESCGPESTDVTSRLVAEMSTGLQDASIVKVGALVEGNFGAPVYSLVSFEYSDPEVEACVGTNADIIEIDSSSGQLVLPASAAGSLNFEVCLPVTDIRYLVTVKASAKSGTIEIECTFELTIDDRNDNPTFELPSVERQIKEKVDKNVPVAVCDTEGLASGCTAVGTGAPEIVAIDQDDDAVLTYAFNPDFGSLQGVDLNDWLFKINPCTGLISAIATGTIAYTEGDNIFSVQVIATDDGNGGRFATKFATQIVKIVVLNVNDNPELFAASFTIAENAVAGSATSPAAPGYDDVDGDSVTLSLQRNDAGAFAIENNRIVTTQVGADTINFESTKATYVIVIEALDGRDGRAERTYTITVDNTNDAPTRLGTDSFYFPENSATGTQLCRSPTGVCSAGLPADHLLQVADEDVLAGFTSDSISFSIVGTDDVPLDNRFAIDNNGKLTVSGGPQVFDFEAANGAPIELAVRASSTGPTEIPGVQVAYTDIILRVFLTDVNESPLLPDAAAVAIECVETAPVGIALDTLIVATDEDNLDTGVGAQDQLLTYRLAGVNANFDVQTVDEGAGKGIIVPKVKLDFESAPGCVNSAGPVTPNCYDVQIQVVDNGNPSKSDTKTYRVMMVDVNEAPYFTTAELEIDLDENYAQGTAFTIATDIAANDIDENDAGALVYEIVGGNGVAFFSLTTTGVAAGSFRIVRNEAAILSFEASNRVWSLKVQAKDGGTSRRVGGGCVLDLVGGINDCGVGAFCNTDERCYEDCVGSTETPNPNDMRPYIHKFFCDYATFGTPADLVREVATTNVLINIQDINDPPTIESSVEGDTCVLFAFVGNDNNAISTIMNDLKAVTNDEDHDDTAFTYVLSGTDLSYFAIDNTGNGKITYPDVNNKYPAVVGRWLNGTITVSDGEDSSDCTLAIRVVDSNNPPVFVDQTTPSLPEDAEAGTVVYTLEASDVDNDEIRFTMSESANFNLNGTSGKITVGDGYIDFETRPFPQQYALIVAAFDYRDGESAGARVAATITIPITDVNEAPIFTSNGTIWVPESAQNGDNVGLPLGVEVDGVVVAYDVDADDVIAITIDSATCAGDAACPFAMLDSATGQLTVAPGQKLDFELSNGESPWYDVPVIITDLVGLTTGGVVRVEVTDVNEAPVFAQGLTFEIDEGGTGETFLFDMTNAVTDEDAGDQEQLTFTLTGASSGAFEIKTGDEAGRLYVKEGLDYETQQQYTFNVQAKDPADNEATGTIIINVKNVNDVQVSDVTAASDLDCRGSTMVTIKGTNFGLVEPTSSSAATAVVQYQRVGSFRGTSTPPMYSCTNAQVVDDTTITCTAGEGVGDSFEWTVSITVPTKDITGDSATFTSSDVVYSLPVISQVTGVSALSTGTGSLVVITGTCLSQPSDIANFGSSSSFIEYCNNLGNCYKPSGCTVTSANRVECTSVVGMGKDLMWSAFVVGQRSAAAKLFGRYAEPTLDAEVVPNNFYTNGSLADGLVITGANFGPNNHVPERVYLSLEYFDTVATATITQEYDASNCMVTEAHTKIRCTTLAPGVGNNLKVIVVVGSQSSAQGLGAPLVRYNGPVVQTLGGDGSTDASTVGGQLITLRGNGFGPPCGEALSGDEGTSSNSPQPCGFLQALYTKNSIRPATGLPIVYAPPCSVVSDSIVTCLTVPGTGAELQWTLSVAGEVAQVETKTSYASPTVGAYDGEGASDANTEGGQEIQIFGSNFGPLGGAFIEATYGNETSPTEFKTAQCSVARAHERVVCTTVVGAGEALSWIVIVDGQESQSQLTDYGRPQIFDIVGPGVGVDNEASPDGKEVVVLTGRNFGEPPANIFEPSKYLETVTYGPESEPFLYKSKCVVDSHTQLTCLTEPGVGQNLVWQVRVRGQTSPKSAPIFNYRPPEIADNGVSPLVGRTGGGYIMKVRGTGFPLCDPETTLRVRFGDKMLDVQAAYQVLDDANNVRVRVTAEHCPKDDDDPTIAELRELEVRVPEMTGLGEAKIVVVLSGRTVGLMQESNEDFEFSYDQPIINGVFAEPNSVPGELLITLNGDNFCTDESCCRTQLGTDIVSEQVNLHTHTQISFVTSITNSLVAVICSPSRKTVSVNVGIENPFVFGTSPLNLNDLTYNTKPAANEMITVFGLYFGQSDPDVQIGGRNATVDYHGIVSCTDPKVPTAEIGNLFDSDFTCFETRVFVPAGQGLDQQITVAVGLQASLGKNAFAINYLPPSVDAIEGLEVGLPTVGSSPIVITGSNFGEGDGAARVRIGAADLLLFASVTLWEHGRIECLLPAGEGKELAIVVEVGGQTSDVSVAPLSPDGKRRLGETFTMSYLPPNNVEMEDVDEVETSGGGILMFSGENLGRPYVVGCEDPSCTPIGPVVLVGGVFQCEVVASSHEFINCTVPEGEGKNLQVEVNVASQTFEISTLFSYAAPVIDFVSPLEANTDGTNEGSTVMTIVGRNFGVSTVEVLLDGFVVAERGITVGKDDFFTQSHEVLELSIPEYLGKDLPLLVRVAGQESGDDTVFSYRASEVDTVTIIDEDGNEVTFDLDDIDDVDTGCLFCETAAASSGGGIWTSGGAGACVAANRAFPGMFIRTRLSTVVGESAEFQREVDVYRMTNATLPCDPSSLEYTALVTGSFADERPSESVGCAFIYKEDVETVVVSPSSADGTARLALECECAVGTTLSTGNTGEVWKLNEKRDVTLCVAAKSCTPLDVLTPTGTAFGLYVVTAADELFMSRTFLSVDALESAETIEFANEATASKALGGGTEVVSDGIPTSGCYQYESDSSFQERLEAAYRQFGSSLGIFRKCTRKAIMHLNGTNFGTNSQGQPGLLRVFFYNNETGVEFEAATTGSSGGHPEMCTVEDGCRHEHTFVAFQVPPGYGRNVRVKAVVGNRIVPDLGVVYNYAPPRISYVSPGTVSLGTFADASGQAVDLHGDNFGGISSVADVLIGGKVCANATWESGDKDPEGKPFLSCVAPRDVVGSKNLFVCVANQMTFRPAVSSDIVTLQSGDIEGAWNNGPDTLGYGRDVFSIVTSRCKARNVDGISQVFMGQMFELCTECPTGAECDALGSVFQPLPSKESFYRLSLDVRDENDEVPDRVKERCPAEQWDVSFLAKYPQLYQREACYDYVPCEPAEACIGDNKCSDGYKWAFNECTVARLEPTRDNSCAVVQNVFTGEWQGVQTDCNPNQPQTCSNSRPWECSKCVVTYPEGADIPLGVCECTEPPRCALCTVSEYYRLNNECQLCPDNPGLLIAMFVVGVLCAIVGGYVLSKKKFNLAFISIGIDYFQVLALFAGSKILWPPGLVTLFNLLSVFNFNIDITAPECLVPDLEYETKWFLTEALPLAVMALLFVVHILYTFVKMVRLNKRTRFNSHVSQLIAIYLVLFYYLYLSVTKRALDIFNCNPTTPDDGNLYTSFASLSCDYGGLCRCGDPGGVQERLVPPAIIVLGLYSFGFPLFVLFVVYKNRSMIVEDQYLRAYGIGDDRATNPNSYDIRKRFHKLYYHFKPDKVYWIVYIITRKFWIAFSSLMFRGNPAFQLSVVLLVLFWSFVMQVMNKPYMSTSQRKEVLQDLDEKAKKALDDEDYAPYRVLQTKLTAAVKVAKEIERKQKTKKYALNGDFWTQERNAKKQSIGGRAAEYIFDYNTVEAVLLACAILVCLSGIMFESGRFERTDVQYQRDMITYAVFIIIIGSMMYYFMVFVSELAPSFSVWLFGRCLKGKNMDEYEDDNLDDDLVLAENPLMHKAQRDLEKEKRLQRELKDAGADLDDAEQVNKKLRDELRARKKAEQANDEGGRSAFMTKAVDRTKKQFNQMRLSFRPQQTRRPISDEVLPGLSMSKNMPRGRVSSQPRGTYDSSDNESGAGADKVDLEDF